MRVACCFVVLAASLSCPANAQMLSGPATAVDGRTLEMTGTRIRLAHIDSPEAKQVCEKDGKQWACGADSTASLAEIVAGEAVSCVIVAAGSDGLPLATCNTRIFDIGQEMVRRGLALPQAGAPPEFLDAAEIAQDLKFGLRGAMFQSPAEWRLANPQSVQQIVQPQPARTNAAAARSDSGLNRRYTNEWGCAIKGNRSRRGDWIYHLPGQNYYEGTRPEELFCTERDAQVAGYRRSKE